MDADACFQLGYIKATHGLKGEVQLVLDVDQPSNYYKLESVFLDQRGDGTLVPFFVEYIRAQGEKLIVKFEEVNHQLQAKSLIGSTVHLPLDLLPPLSGTSYYFHEIIGCRVLDMHRGELGTVTCIYDQGPQRLVGMEYQGHEVLIPFTEEIIRSLDRDSGAVLVNLPEGLLEIYQENQSSDHED